jgi:ribose transport system substrate-binding protein
VTGLAVIGSFGFVGSHGGKTVTAASPTAAAASCVNKVKVGKGISPDGSLYKLPKSVQANYLGYAEKIVKSPWANFKRLHKPPWTIDYNNSFAGNAWRASALQTLKTDFNKYKKAGLVKKLIVTDSNGNTTLQIQQMRSAIQQKVDLIISIPGSPDAMNGVIQEAYKAHIPVVTIAAVVTSKYALNYDTNEFLIGKNMATGLVQLMKGKGNIMTVEGIPGTPGSAEIKQGGYAVLNKCPQVKVVDDIYGQWSESIAKTQMLQALATHPQKLNGVWQQGSMFMGITQALQQAGRPSIPVTVGNPNQNSLAYWHDHLKNGYKTVGTANPPGADMDAGFRIGIATLEGQGPKVNTFVAKPPLITTKTLNNWWKPSYKETSTGVGEPPKNHWLPTTELHLILNHPKPLPPTEFSS